MNEHDADPTLARDVITQLSWRGETLAFCESLTAGLAAATVACVPGASAVLRGGLVTYATEVKSHFLHKPVADIEAQGVVSAATAQEMAVAAVTETGASWGVSFTGVAGPDLQEGKPAGTVYVGIAGPQIEPIAVKLEGLSGGRDAIRQGSVTQGLSLLLSTLAKN